MKKHWKWIVPLVLLATVALILLVPRLTAEKAPLTAAPEAAAVEEVDAPAETPEPTPEPTPAPTPFVEPELEEGGPVTFDGTELASGSYLHDGVQYVRLAEAVSAIGAELEHEEGSETFSFPWRKSQVTLQAYSTDLIYLDESRVLEAEALLCDGGEELLVPVESFCLGAQIGLLYDEENDHLYCTPGAGDWEIPQGYNVPVMMYHGVGWGSKDANLFVNPADLEEQIVYMLEHGYTPIWFSDLEHVEDYEKPVLLTFDDGWQNNYTNLLPLVEKYNVKVTVFAVCRFFTSSGNHLDEDEALEMYASGLVDFQSHTVNHDDLTYLTPERQEYELRESRLFLTRMFGKEPFVLSYPIGGSNEAIQELASQYYHFAVKMIGPIPLVPYNTSDDPMLVYRFFPEKWTPLSVYISWLESAFPPEAESEQNG